MCKGMSKALHMYTLTLHKKPLPGRHYDPIFKRGPERSCHLPKDTQLGVGSVRISYLSASFCESGACHCVPSALSRSQLPLLGLRYLVYEMTQDTQADF